MILVAVFGSFLLSGNFIRKLIKYNIFILGFATVLASSIVDFYLWKNTLRLGIKQSLLIDV